MNKIVGVFHKKALMITLGVCLFIGFAMPAKATSIEGVAPLHRLIEKLPSPLSLKPMECKYSL